MKSQKANSEPAEAATQFAQWVDRKPARPADFGSSDERKSAMKSRDHPAGPWARAGEATPGEPLPTSRWCLDDYAAGEGVVASQHERPNQATHPAGCMHCAPLPTSRWGFDE